MTYNLEVQTQERRKDFIVKLVLFIISPFVSFLYSLKDPKTKSSYLIYFLFGIIFCWNMAQRNPYSTNYDDFIGIKQRYEAKQFSNEKIQQELYDYFTFSDNSPKEMFEDLMIWTTKSILDNYHLFFALCSLFYLLFMLRSLKTMTDEEKFPTGFAALSLMALFVLPRDIITVQNPRYTVGFWYSVFCIMSYFKNYRSNKKYSYAILILFTPFFHSAFWPFVFIFYFAALIKLPPTFMMVIYILSVPFSYLSNDIANEINLHILPVPQKIMEWVNIYLSDSAVAKSQVKGTGFWIVGFCFKLFLKTLYGIMPFIIWHKARQFKIGTFNRNLWNFYLVSITIISFIQPIPELGSRYYFFIETFSIYVWYKLMYPHNRVYFILLNIAWIWPVFHRYFYTGAVSICVPSDIWYSPLPMLIMEGFAR